MSAPWERYQQAGQQNAPWLRYQTGEQPAPEKPKAPTATEGFLGKVGDFIVDNLGGASATMRDNARTGTFAQDAAKSQGFLDWAGSALERGAAGWDEGIYNFLGGLGSQKARDAARELSGGTTSQKIVGKTEWEDVNDLGSLGSYILGAGIESLPAMGALAVPVVGPMATATSQTGNIASERARNNGQDFISGTDLANAAPAAILSTALDRLGLKGIKNPVGNTVTGRIAGAATREGLTEAAQSGIEYTGGTLGTDAGFKFGEAFNQSLAGGAAGFGMGGAGRVAMEPVDAFMARRGGAQPQAGQGEPIDSDWEGSLDDMLGGQQDAPWQKYQAPDNPLLALPAPAAYVDSLGDTAIGSDGLTQLERTRAERRINAGKPEGNPIDAFMRKARGAESAGDDTAKNPRSSATGRYQFIDSTWLATYRQEFPNTGETDAQILAKRGDGRLQDRLMRRLTQGNAATLQGAGIPVDTGNLYLAHFAGPAGALALHRNPNASAESILGKSVIKANPFLKGMTGADVIQWAAGKMGGGGGFTSRAGNALDGMPEIDMPMPQRRDNNTAVLPELSGQDFRVAPIAPEQAQNDAAQPAQQQNDNQPTQPAIERQPLPEAPPARRGQISQVVAPRVGPVDTMFELRDMAELVDSSNPVYDKTLQPRDRAGRAASGAQVASIAGTLDPRQLGDSRLASTGAPIIGPDGQVESGNGRIAALRQVYAQFPEQAAAYRQMIADTGLDATGLQFPVLVRRRTTEMTPEQRQAWTRAANERDTMAMSSTEQATADARQLPDSTLSLYRGGPVTAAGNRDFVRAFIERAVAPAERNAMVAPDGSLSVDGARRIRFALLARAYGDSELIGRIAEDTDTNIAAIGKALLEAAPAMAKLRAGIDAGEIPPQYDISANIAEAARMVARSRDTGQSLQGMLAQTDAFADPIAPETEAVLRLFYNDAELKRARSAVKIADDLIDYARMAETQAANAAQGNDMFGNAPVLDSPATLLQRVRSGDDAAQGDMLAPAPESAYAAPDEQGSRPDRQTAPARPAGVERDGGSRSAVPTLARGQLRALGIAAQLRTEKAAALVGRTASTPRELAEIAQVYRDPRYETFRIFLTKGDTIVHATGVSSRSVSEAPLMPKGMKTAEFIAGIKQTMAETGADGFYLLHNHPSGVPDPSRADKNVTRDLAGLLPGFRAHIVINSNKYATIDLDQSGRVRSKVSNLNAGEEKLLAASIPHDVLGRRIQKGGDLIAVGKELQKPGWITVIGVDSKLNTRVIVDYPASTAKKDVRNLMAMARRIQTQSGSSSLFLVGDRAALDNPTVKRAIGGGIVTAAIDMDGKQIGEAPSRGAKIPKPPARFVAEETGVTPEQVSAFEADLKERLGLSNLSLFLSRGNLKLNMIAVGRGNQGRGIGTQAMEAITDFADQNGLKIVLTPGLRDGDFGTTSRSRLVKFYKRFGFVENKGRNKDFAISEGMIREPMASMREETAPFQRDTINVNGKDRPTVNSNGQPIARDEAALRNFWNWFGDSKVVDAQGRPLVVYHGTNDKFEAFDQSAIGKNATALGYGFYFAEREDVAKGYQDNGQVLSVYLSAQNPVDVDASGLSASNAEKLVRKAVELEVQKYGDEIADYRDSFISNVVDTYSTNERDAIRETARLLADNGTVVDAIAELANIMGGKELALRAAKEGLGIDAIHVPDFQEGDGQVWVMFQPEQIKSVNNRGTFDPADPRILMEDVAPFERDNEYPIAPKSEWYGEGTYKADGGRMVYVSPQEYLAAVKPLQMDAESRENIDDLKAHIQSGKTLDPLLIRASGKEDGRHRAYAALELGITRVPVIAYGNQFENAPAVPDDQILMEDTAPFDRGRDPGPSIADGLVDKDGLTRDVQKIRDIVGNPVQALKGIMRSGLADNVRALTYSMDSRMRAFAKKYNSPAITELANHFYALAGTGGGPVTETYHEAVEREGFGRAGQALRILEPFIGDKAAMERITRMLRLPGERSKGKRAEAEAAAKLARLLKDTLDYRREAGEDIGEVTTGYFPRMLDVEKVVQNREAFLRNATELFKIHDAPNPRASAEAWLARTFDQYAGIDGGLDLIDLFHDTRPAGVGRRTTKPRKFGEDADRLLGSFYQNDTGEVLTAYFIGGAKRAEEARRFGGEKMKALFDRIQEDIRASGLDGGDATGALARMVATNLGRVETPSERVRGTVSFLQTASQLGTLDRALITSLSESMMGFVRGGARYGLPMLIRSAREFARQVRKAPPSEAARMAEALGIAQDALIGEALAARSGFERGQTSRRAQKVQQGFFRANGLEQWTTGTRAAATKMGQEALHYLATDMATGRARNATKYLNELGITDPRGFSRWLLDGGNPTPEQLIGQEVSPNAREYRTALLRFVNQTIMKPSRAEKPRWASHPVLGMFFSLMSYSYGFKKNVLDRAGRMIARGVKEKDPSLLYPAFGLAALFATHTVINNVIRQAILGGGREDEEEGITFTDWVEALDRAGLFGAASPLINAAFGVRYNRSLTESAIGPVLGRPADAATKALKLFTERNSDNTNTGERAAAGALYDVVLEPALEAYGVTRFKGPAAAAIVWGSGNREGGIVPPDRDIFVEAVAGPKEEK